jgi:ethanolamine ammonia-lyase small subunit
MAKTPASAAALSKQVAESDDYSDLDDEEIRQLKQDIAESDAQIARGDVVSAEAVMANLRRILHG